MNRHKAAALLAALVGSGAGAHTSAKYGYSIQPPAGWQQGSVPGFAADFFYTPQPVAGFSPNINVLEPVQTQGAAPAAICTSSVQLVKTGLKARGAASTFDRAANVCRITYRASPQGTELRFYAELRFSPGRYHTLTFTAPDGAYQKLLPTVRASFGTFQAR